MPLTDPSETDVTLPDDLYRSDGYLRANPTWGSEDSRWKSEKVSQLMMAHGLNPDSICDVGCGAGGCLAALRSTFPEATLYGFDIAPALVSFWQVHSGLDIKFRVGDFLQINEQSYDVVLLLDVVEHLIDPFNFLKRIRAFGTSFVFHFPLDLSAVSVIREHPLLHVRRTVGHIHYFTKNLALSLLAECGFKVIESRYTGAAFSSPQRTFKTMLAQLPRRIAYELNKDVGVRLLGGETLLVLAERTNDD